MPEMKSSRRDLLLTLPAASMSLALPTIVASDEPKDPILDIYRQWADARANWLRLAALPENGNFDMPESLEAAEQKQAAFSKMIEMTPISTAGIAALVHVLWDLEGPCVSPEHENYQEQVNAPNCKLMLAVWRAAVGQKDIPPSNLLI